MCEHARAMGPSKVKPSPISGGSESLPVTVHSPVFTQLREFFATLQGIIDPSQRHDPKYIESVKEVLRSRILDKAEWAVHANFHQDKYTRNLIAHDEHFTVLLLCWNKGQRSPIHDHAGSNCWVKVLAGHMRELRYSSDLELIANTQCAEGDVTYIDDSMGLHDMGNDSKDECCVSMHIYSPPYYYCRAYDLATHNRRDVAMLSVNAPRKGAEAYKLYRPAGLAENNGPLSIKQFISETQRAAGDVPSILKSFQRLMLDQSEVDVLANFSEFWVQRILLHNDEAYSLVLMCWLPKQSAVLEAEHDSHGRLLAGDLVGLPHQQQQQDDVSRTSAAVLVPAKQQITNASSSYAISLHLFTPRLTCESGESATTGAAPSTPIVQGELSNPCGISNTAAAAALTHIAGDELFKSLASQLSSSTSPSTTASGAIDDSSILSVIRTLENLTISQDEIDYYVKNRDWLGYRVLIFDGGHFNAVLNIWEPQQESVVHDHVDSHAWVRILDGSLFDLEYTIPSDEALPGRVVRCVSVQKGSVSYSGPSVVHALRNPCNEHLSVSLHVYSPPCTACRWHSIGVNVKRSTTKISSITTRAKGTIPVLQ